MARCFYGLRISSFYDQIVLLIEKDTVEANIICETSP